MAIVIGDVSGKGLEAAELAVTTRSAVGAFGYDLSSPKEALTHANSLFFARQAELERFVMAFMIVVYPPTGHVLYVGDEHPQPIMRRVNGDIELLAETVPFDIADDSCHGEADSHIMPGDTLPCTRTTSAELTPKITNSLALPARYEWSKRTVRPNLASP